MMETEAKVPTWYWAVAVIALLWAAAGCFAYVSQVSMGPEQLAQLPAEQREIWAMMPAWVKGAYAIAVWAGLAGAIGLLVRRRWARTAYAVSLVAVLIQFGWTFFETPILETVGAAASLPFPLFIIALGALLLWLSNKWAAEGRLR